MSALDGVDAVCHQAGRVGLGVDFADAASYVDVNDIGWVTGLSAMHDVDFCGRIVLASSMVVYGEGRYRCFDHGVVRPAPRRVADLDRGRFEPPCPTCGAALLAGPIPEDAPLDPRNVYAATKLHQEHLLAAFAREHPVDACALRYHNVYGPRMPRDTPYAGVASIFRSALEAGTAPQVTEDGRQRRDFVHVGDVAAVNVAALLRDEPIVGAVNVGSGTPRSVGELAEALATSMGVRRRRGQLADGHRRLSARRRAPRLRRHVAPRIACRRRACGVRRRHGRVRPRAAARPGGPVDEPGRQEDALVDRLCAGDGAAFTEVVRAYNGSLVRLASSFVPSRAVAEEVVQETWMAVIKGLPRVRAALDVEDVDHRHPGEHRQDPWHQGAAHRADGVVGRRRRPVGRSRPVQRTARATARGPTRRRTGATCPRRPWSPVKRSRSSRRLLNCSPRTRGGSSCCEMWRVGRHETCATSSASARPTNGCCCTAPAPCCAACSNNVWGTGHEPVPHHDHLPAVGRAGHRLPRGCAARGARCGPSIATSPAARTAPSTWRRCAGPSTSPARCRSTRTCPTSSSSGCCRAFEEQPPGEP